MEESLKGPSTLATLFSHMWPRFCGGDIYSRRKPLFSSFSEHTAVCGSSVRQAVARPRHRQSVCIHNIHVAATCRPSVLGSATKRGHMWLNKVASVLGPLNSLSWPCEHQSHLLATSSNLMPQRYARLFSFSKSCQTKILFWSHSFSHFFLLLCKEN